ncbi:TolC family protein, partial [bacterium]|nr:TolC family protein [bacterium]
MKSLIKLSSILLAIALSSGALTLDEAIERGLAANSQVSMAGHETDAARESARMALTNLFPRASANASYTRLDETPTMTMPPEFGGMTIPMGQQDN